MRKIFTALLLHSAISTESALFEDPESVVQNDEEVLAQRGVSLFKEM